MAAGLSVLAAMAVWAYPSFASSIDIDELLAAYPEPLLAAFGVRSMATLGGFLAVELYAFGWVLLFGLYLAYEGAGVLAGDVGRRRMDLLLSLPVSRERVVVERFLALAVPVAVVNAVVAVVVLAAAAVGEPLSTADLLAVHALSVPYLFACAAVGLACSAVASRAAPAQRAALGLTFGLYLVESLAGDTALEPVGALAPTRYFDPSAVLVDGTYDVAGAAVLLAMTAALVAAAAAWFARRDV